METKVILKYHRQNERWLCSECETENDMTRVKCIVCGVNRKVSDSILHTFDEPVDYDNGHVNPQPDKKGGYHSQPAPAPYINPNSEKSQSNNWKWYVAVIVIAALVIISSMTSEACSLMCNETQPEHLYEFAVNLSERFLI